MASIDSIVAAAYESISGPAGQRRGWDRLRSLCWPGSRLMPVRIPPQSRWHAAQVWTVEDFISRVSARDDTHGFFERSIANRVERWANIAHVLSVYESRRALDAPPFARGINSFQLFNDGQRWWILGVMWQDEGDTNPIPAGLLVKP